MTKWEYSWRCLPTGKSWDESLRLLEQMGNEGWELASTVLMAHLHFYFKRPLPPESPDFSVGAFVTSYIPDEITSRVIGTPKETNEG